jgi:hypothetical protein
MFNLVLKETAMALCFHEGNGDHQLDDIFGTEDVSTIAVGECP